MPWPLNWSNQLSCTVKTYKQMPDKVWLSVGCYLNKYSWVLHFCITSQADDAVVPLDDNFKSKENPAPTFLLFFCIINVFLNLTFHERKIFVLGLEEKVNEAKQLAYEILKI